MNKYLESKASLSAEDIKKGIRTAHDRERKSSSDVLRLCV